MFQEYRQQIVVEEEEVVVSEVVGEVASVDLMVHRTVAITRGLEDEEHTGSFMFLFFHILSDDLR